MSWCHTAAAANGEQPPLPRCATMAIGTLPHTDAAAAVEFMIRHNPVCPSWPQLPQMDFREGMYLQYSEGMPAAVIDGERHSISFDLERAPEAMADFYEHILEEDWSYCAISPEFARSFELFIQALPLAGARFVKGQVTGPSSFGLTVTDRDLKPVLYASDLFEALVQALACKGRWQVERFRQAAPELTPVVFFDEPYLTQVGSALISLPADQVIANLNECFAAIDGLTGVHVCGGTDWGILAATSADILHFDAFDHSREFLLYEKELAVFMERGGMIAWGIIPTDERAADRNVSQLAEKVMREAEQIAAFCPSGIDAGTVLERSFISEACGTGTLSLEVARHCFSGALEVADALRRQIC